MSATVFDSLVWMENGCVRVYGSFAGWKSSVCTNAVCRFIQYETRLLMHWTANFIWKITTRKRSLLRRTCTHTRLVEPNGVESSQVRQADLVSSCTCVHSAIIFTQLSCLSFGSLVTWNKRFVCCLHINQAKTAPIRCRFVSLADK